MQNKHLPTTTFQKLRRLFIACILCSGITAASAGVLQPVPLPPINKIRYKDEATRIYRLIENQARYLLSLVHSRQSNEQYKLLTAAQGIEEHIIRPNTSAVATFAFLYRYGPYSEQNVGISRSELLETNIIPMLRHLVSVHKIGDRTFDDGTKWGLSWQSALWTTQLGQAVWVLWDKLPDKLRSTVLQVVNAEADRIIHREPPFRLKFDSKSEENAWDATVLSVAMLLMPDSPLYDDWERALIKWQMSAYSTPSDAFCEQIADGKPVKEHFLGANIHDDYTLENHGIAHPDYMCATAMNLEVALDYLITGRKPLDASLYNCDKVYAQLKFLLLPGAQLVYPSGQDWAIFRGVDYVDLHAFHLLYFRDAAALHWFRECISTAEKMQHRHMNGAIYASNENFFPSAQAHLGYYLTMAWKALMFAEMPNGKLKSIQGTKTYLDGKFFVRRTDRAIHTVSWGRKLMIQTLADSTDPIVAPDWQNGIGFIRLQGQTKPLPVRLDGFRMEEGTGNEPCRFYLTVLHGDAVKAELTVESFRNGSLKIRELLTTQKEITTEEIATLSIGILNHPGWIYEKGSRTVRTVSSKTIVPSLSGKSFVLSGKNISIDSRLTITACEEIIGSYTGARKWVGSKAVDRIVLNHQKTPKHLKSGSLLSDQTVTISYRGAEKR